MRPLLSIPYHDPRRSCLPVLNREVGGSRRVRCEIIVLASAVECGVLSFLALRNPNFWSTPDEVPPLAKIVEAVFFILQASTVVLVHVYFIMRFFRTFTPSCYTMFRPADR